MRTLSALKLAIAGLCSLAAFPLFGEVVYLNDGQVLIGTLAKPVAGLIDFTGSIKNLRLEPKDIRKTESDIHSLLDKDLEVMLKDHSVIRGRYVDFDEELGLFVDISFGTLDLPLAQIDTIYLVDAKKSRDQPKSVVGVGFYLALPIQSDVTGLSYMPSLSFESKLPFLHGIYLGENVDYVIMSFKASNDVAFRIAGFSLIISAKLIPLFSGRETTKLFSPYISLGAGSALISIIDNRAGAQNQYYGTFNFLSKLKLGVEIGPLPHFSIDAGGGLAMIMQQSGPFWLASGGLTFRYDF